MSFSPLDGLRLIIWRHGQTDWNIANRFQGHSDIPLNRVGELQAERAARILQELQPSAIISSDLQRALSTASALSRAMDLPIERDVQLRETNGGAWEGKTGSENRLSHPELFHAWLSGSDDPAGITGERRTQVALRASSAIFKKLSAMPSAQTLVIVTHGGTARGILGKLLHLPLERWGVLGGLSNAAWSILEPAHHQPEFADQSFATIMWPEVRWILTEHNAGSLPEPVYGDDDLTESDPLTK